VAQAEAGPAALAQATAAPPDLILLDLMMPGMNGFEVCQRLKHDPATASVPVIVVTALAQIKDKEAALTSGADDFLTKPVNTEDLRTRVAAMLKVRGIRQELDRTLAYLHELHAATHAQRRAALATLVAAAPPAPSPPTLLPILLVDDEALTRDFYGDLLSEHGFRVFAASNGSDALELARQHPLEAVILDIMMPGMSGLEVLERLHAQDPDLPLIMLTAHPSSQNAIAALKMGAFDFIVKGLQHDLVVLAVHRAVRHRRETLARLQEIARLRARIAELEGGRRGQ
jgi:two-component system cell cycle response regulator